MFHYWTWCVHSMVIRDSANQDECHVVCLRGEGTNPRMHEILSYATIWVYTITRALLVQRAKIPVLTFEGEKKWDWQNIWLWILHADKRLSCALSSRSMQSHCSSILIHIWLQCVCKTSYWTKIHPLTCEHSHTSCNSQAVLGNVSSICNLTSVFHNSMLMSLRYRTFFGVFQLQRKSQIVQMAANTYSLVCEHGHLNSLRIRIFIMLRVAGCNKDLYTHSILTDLGNTSSDGRI